MAGTMEPVRLRGTGLSALVLLALSSAGLAQGRETLFLQKQWDTKDGLPQNTISDIVQTRDGYLWLATFGGLTRFDGVRFSVYDIANTPALGSNRILSLCEAADGALWIGTQGGGVDRLQDGVFTYFGESEGGPRGFVWRIVEDPAGTLWFGGKGLSRFVDGRFEHVPLGENPDAEVFALFGEADGTLWIGTSDGLFVRGTQEPRRYTQADGLPEDRVLWIGRDPGGRIWVSTASGMALLQGERFRTLAARISPGVVAASMVDRRGEPWAVGRDGAFYVREPLDVADEPFVPASIPLLGSGGVRAVLEDREGNVWIGTNGEGLLRMRPSPFACLEERHGMPAAAPRELQSDGADGVWVSFSDDSVGRVRERSFEPSATASELMAARPAAMCTDPAGRLWIADAHGLTLVEDEHATPFPHELPPVETLLATPDGSIWAGHAGGLSRFLDGQWADYALPDPALGPVWIVGRGRDGSLWLAGMHALVRFDVDAERFTVERSGGIPRGELRSAHEDADGALWITTYGSGLLRFQDGVLQDFTTADGLADDQLGGLVETSDGTLWINGNRGVFAVKRGDLSALARGEIDQVRCKTLPTGEGNGASACQGAGGRLWFPTIYGIVVVDPALVTRNEVPPLVAIESVEAGGRSQEAHGPLTLGPESGDLVFTFTALSFADPGAVRFRYRLEGYDPGWNDAGDRRRANYTNIPPGAYRFHVVACNEDGVWNERGAELALTLRPYFYQTTWFLALCGLLGANGLFAFYRIRTRAIRRRNVALRTEIQERERAERARQESEERYRVVAEAAMDAILTVDERGVILYANPATERIFGHAPEACIGQPLSMLVPERLRESYEGGLGGYLRGEGRGRTWEGLEIVGRHADGHEIPVEVSLGVLQPVDGSPRFTGIVRDITERKRTQEEKGRLEERLRESKKMEAMGRLAGGISHDFNNILTVVLSHAELLEERLRAESVNGAGEHVVEIKKCTELAFSLTSQLLAFSRRQVLQPTLLDPCEVLTRLEPMLRRLIRDDVELSIVAPASVGLIRADVGQLEQIVMNLVLNACDAMREGGVVRVEVAAVELDGAYVACRPGAEPGSHVLISVSDSGDGIPEEDLPHVFEPFFTTKAPGHGTGLGLASVHGIVEQSGGHITVSSEPGAGTTLRVYLPRAEESAPRDAGKRPTEATSADSLAGSETILVCDDYAAVRHATATILEKSGYHVLSAESPQDALRLAREHPTAIQLLITDVVMPQMNGPQLAAEVAAVQPGLRVLYVSGYTADVAIDAGVTDVGAGFLQKPFAFRNLLRKIRDLLDVDVRAS